jgi:hypothetical protein
MKKFRKNIKLFRKPAHRVLALTIVFSILFQLGVPTCALALTGGPSQPEVQSFEPVSTSDMVDPFSGGFNYNIPLLNVDGYPINIAYHNGVTMDQEASWVGLGWNINPGVINRNVRGIPDDFDGENIQRDFHVKDNHTYGVTTGVGVEFFGAGIGLNLSFGLGAHWNNYTGLGADISLNVGITVGDPSAGALNFGLGIDASSDDGITISPSIGLSLSVAASDNTAVNLGVHVGCSFNSRQGLSQVTVGTSIGVSAKVDAQNATTGKSEQKTLSESLPSPGATFNLMQTTFTPQVTLPMNNLSITGSVKVGGEVFGLDASANLGGYYSSQSLAATTESNPAFGYMHADDGVKYSNAMMDFNREKDMPFTSSTPDLPITNFTYDIFSASGQGMSGSYRPFRSDEGHVFDPAASNTGNGYTVGAEVGVGDLFHAGLDFTANNVNTTSGDWLGDNNAASYLSYTSFVPGNPLYEPVYFKEANEKSVDADPTYFQKAGGMQPQSVNLDQISQFNTVADSKYESGLNLSSNNYRQSRDIRNQSISMLNHGQVESGVGLDDAAQLGLVYTGAQNYHIGEITTLGTDGKRYVYGIAAYNTMKKEVTFAIGEDASGNLGPGGNVQTGLVSYSPGSDNSTSNGRGIDNYYSGTTTPPYAHSYLLTSVLSTDYVDADNIKGPSDGDLGTWTKFNYTKVTTPSNMFNWRVPVGANMASFQEGLKSDPTDDKANYLYGQKELFYLQSIETKNYIAVFSLSDRQDGLGVTDENGAISSSVAPKKIDSISLYTKPNYNAHQANNSIPLIPIECVHFVYDYSLCPGVPNNLHGGGKLTLRQIYFTYQGSFKGRLSPYQFDYGKIPGYGYMNPAYSLTAYDRWGYYQENNATDYGATSSVASPAEFPYVDQNKTNEDRRVAAWTLTDIVLPSGGSIHVDYESNDYAYVQNLPAMEMCKIESTNLGTIPETPLSVVPLNDQNYGNNFLVFPLQLKPDNVTYYDPQDYVNGINNLYFRVLGKISKPSGPPTYEYVSGYATIKKVGPTTNPAYGYIELNTADLDENGKYIVNPIIKAILQFGRISTPRVVWNEPSITDGDGLLDIFPALASAIGQISSVTVGLNGSLYVKGLGQNIVIDKSWLRLNDPTGKKLGGGARVKDVLIYDNWNIMTANVEKGFDYGQQYSYTLADGVTSSGVASYEPQLGGDENPWRQPIFYDSQKLLVPDDKHYVEQPLGESFFPSASVGYSMVTVKNLQRAGVHRDATGTVVNEFYTTKDFPTVTKQTDLQEIHEKSDPTSISSLFNIDVKDYMTASEGYEVDLNDMNGKPAAKYVYQEGQVTPISSVQYYYQRTPYLGDGSFTVNNTVNVINKDGTVSPATVGVFFDNVADFRQSETDNTSTTVMGNVDAFLCPFPVVVPIFLPSFASQTTRFRSAVVTKVVQQFGILDSTVVTDLGSRVSTQNLAYDAESGEVLLTKTANDYNDPIYNLTYPAYWYYDAMGPAYRNIGLNIGVNFYSPGQGTVSGASGYFSPGDEIIRTDGVKGWVTKVSGNTITVEDKTGAAVSAGNYNVEIIRSGRRNMQTMDMEKVTTLVNPISGLQSNTFAKVTQASAKVYADSWSTYCQCFTSNTDGVSDNPYVLGTKGDFRLKTSFLYLTPRDQSSFDNNTNTRQDGTFNSYNPFYTNNSGNWSTTPDNWTFTSTVTNFNPYGQEIEDQDALGRFSSATFGYNQTLPTAVAANSKYQEMGFDGFEDYGFNGCADNHLDVPRSTVTLDPTQSHTGRHSLKISSGDSVIIGGILTNCPAVSPCTLTLCDSGQFNGGAIQNIKFQPNGGTAPYSFTWNLINGYGAQSVNINPYGGIYFNRLPGLSTGNYTLKVTDAAGCSYTVSFGTDNYGNIVTNPAIPRCAGCNLSVCYSLVPYLGLAGVQFQTSGGTAPYTYTIARIGGNPVFANSQIGNDLLIGPNTATYDHFTLTVTDANGCTFTAIIKAHFLNINNPNATVVAGVPHC